MGREEDVLRGGRAVLHPVEGVVLAFYLADALIPAYRHLFVRQTKALLLGWRDMAHVLDLFKRN